MEVMQVMYVMYGFIFFETLLLLLVFWKTPARLFLIASLQKKAIMLIIGKDNIGYLRAFKPKNGCGVVKGFGTFHLTEDSHILEFGTRMPFYIAFRDVAATIWPEYPALLQELKEMGKNISSLAELEEYIKKAEAVSKEDVRIHIKPFKSYNMAAMRNAFPFNLDPTFIDSEIQCAIAQYLRRLKEKQTWLIGIAVFLVIAGIATLIFMRAFRGQIAVTDCKIMTEVAVNAVKCAPEAIKTIVNTTAAIG